MLATKHPETNDFHELYEPEVCYAEANMEEMVDKIKTYLTNDSMRYNMQLAAYTRREENLWTTRFKNFLGDEFWTN